MKADSYLPLSSAINDMREYIKLTDDVFQKILWSRESQLKEVGSVFDLNIHSEMTCFCWMLIGS